MMIIIPKKHVTMFKGIAVIAVLSVLMNFKMLYDINQYQATTRAANEAMMYLSNQVSHLMGKVDTVTKEKEKLANKVESRRMAIVAASADADCLAKNIYYEAGGESTNGKIAVAMVTRNRMQSGMFPKTACGVVYQAQQFSWVNDNSLAQIAIGSYAWKESKRIAIAVLAKSRKIADITQGSLYFHNKTVRPSWATRDRFTTQIDGHLFYR